MKWRRKSASSPAVLSNMLRGSWLTAVRMSGIQATLQAVAHKNQVAIAVYYAVKELDGFGGITGINQPGLVMLRDLGNGQTEVSFVDPRVLIVEPANDYFRTGSSLVRKIRLTFASPITLIDSNIEEYQAIHTGAQTGVSVSDNALGFDTSNAFTHKFIIQGVSKNAVD